MKLPDLVSMTELAKAQDRVIAEVTPATGLDVLKDYVARLLTFQPLLGVTQLSSPSNLHVRQGLILAALYDAMGRILGGPQPPRGAALRSRAVEAFEVLCTAGLLYVEGWSYFRYVLAAVKFHQMMTGILLPGPFKPEYLEAIQSTFEAMAAEDGFVPATDTHATDLVPADRRPAGAEGFVDHPAVTVWRRGWRGDGPVSHFCVHHDEYQDKFRRNLHVQPMFGHITYHDGEKWIVIPPVYDSWPVDPVKAAQRLATEAERLNVPRGPWNAPVWRTRLLPPRLRFREEDFGRRLILTLSAGGLFRSSSVKRTITQEADGISIVDEGTGTTTVNLAVSASGDILLASLLGPGSWRPDGPIEAHPLSPYGARRYIGTGAHRAFKILNPRKVP